MLPWTALAALVLAGAQAEPPSGAPPRPNVIILITDDQGYGDLSCHGNPVLKTPNLDRLHAESIRFADFHAAPMCTPTRGQLLSGRDCLANGAMNVSSGRTLLRRGLPTIAEIFAASGYHTGHFGKWHVGDNYPFRPQDRGFQEAIFYPSSHIGSAPDFWNNDYFDDTYNHNGKRERFAGYCTDVFFGESMKWMRACAERREPFFAYIATNAPHGPLFVPERYCEPYKDQKPNVARFFGMIANIDENLGKLDAMLRETGLRENTVFLFLTDNGATAGFPIFNAGMRGKKTELYEGGHRVPCFLRWPAGKLRPPCDLPDLAEVQDILPTLVDLCGLRKPEGAAFDGLSLAPLLRGEEDRLPDRMLVVQYSRMGRPSPEKGDAAVMWKSWRLIQDKELYDLAADPAQKANVIGKHPEVAAKMRARYDAWWSQVEPGKDEHGAIVLGSDAENPLQLSPADWEDSFLDQGAQIRSGLRRNGAWNIFVDRDGEYEISLRRWAAEADAPIASGLPPFQRSDGQFPAGVALPIAGARLRVAGIDKSLPVAKDDKAATFTVSLKTGRTKLQTWFDDADSKEVCGAYYVYVRRK